MGSFNKLALCCALLMQGAVLASEYIDGLDLPAKPSALARHSPLLGLAPAGARRGMGGGRGRPAGRPYSSAGRLCGGAIRRG